MLIEFVQRGFEVFDNDEIFPAGMLYNCSVGYPLLKLGDGINTIPRQKLKALAHRFTPLFQQKVAKRLGH
jgi:hypothetical protein